MRGAKGKAEDLVAESWVPAGWRWLVVGFAALWLTVVGLSTASETAANLLPPTPRYFTQMTALFPKATQYSFEYRAQAYTCADHAWPELDYRRWFPMHPDDKENRFQRLGYFYVSQGNRPVIYALEDWLVTHHNAAAAGGDAGDGVAGKIGGIQLFSLRD